MRATADDLMRLMRRKPKEVIKVDLRNMPPPSLGSDAVVELVPGQIVISRGEAHDPYEWFTPRR